MDTQQQQLIFQFINKAEDKTGVPNVIYISDNQDYNLLTLEFTLSQGNVTLTPAQEIVDPDKFPTPPYAATLIYLDLSPLNLSYDDLSSLTFAADQWKCQTFPQSQMVGMTPKSTIQMSSGTSGKQSIGISKLQISQRPTTPTVDLTMQVFDNGFQSPYSSFKVALQNASDGKKENLQDYIHVSLTDESANILNSYKAPMPVSNVIELVFDPGQRPAQVIAGPDTVFNVSFVYGPFGDTYGYGALMSATQALAVKLTKVLNTDNWTTQFHQSAQIISWDLIPPSGQPIIGTGPSATASFNFGSVVTTYQPGPTVMLITYKNIPGYEDGVYTILLNKIPHVFINSLTVTPNPTYAKDGKAQVIVSWDTATDYQTSLWLTQQDMTAKDVSGRTSFPIDLKTESTALTLTAEGPYYNRGNTATVNTTAIALPVINSFIGSPTEIYYGETSHQGVFSWAVDMAGSGQVTLSSTGSAFEGGNTYDPIDSAKTSLDSPQMITLSPKDVNNPLTLTRKIVISAFNPQVAEYPISGANKLANVAASPAAPFIALSDSANNQVIILDTIDYVQIATVPVGQSPGAIAFSADGSLMVVANKGDKSITPVTITNLSGQMLFTPGTPIPNLGGIPQSLLMSPDASSLYVVIDAGTTTNGQLIALSKSGQSYSLSSKATVGVAPRGITASPSGSVFYVANSGDKTVSVIGKDHPGILTTGIIINNVGNQPTDVAITKDSKFLLVTCCADNIVVVLQASQPNEGQRGTVNVGKGPTRISMIPLGDYAFICNSGDNTLTLISCGSTVTNFKPSVVPIKVGSVPTDVAVTPDSMNVLTANSGGKSMNNVVLATYQAVGKAISLDSNMTHAVVSPDKSDVFIWQNPLSGQTSIPGIIAFATASATQKSFFDDNHVISLVFSPLATKKTAYALVYKQNQLFTIDTEILTYTSADLPTTNVSKTLALTISGDGNTLFVAVVDSQSNVVLLVLTSTKDGWTLSQKVQLYTAKSLLGNVLIESSLDGMSICIADPISKKALVVRYTDGQYALNPKSITLNGSTLAMCILPNGLAAYLINSIGASHIITVIDMITLNSEDIFIQQSYVAPTHIASSPDSRRLFISDANSAALRILDPQSLRILQTIKLTSASGGPVQNPFHVAIANDASCIYVVNNMSNDLSIVEQVPMSKTKRHLGLKEAKPSPKKPLQLLKKQKI